MQVELSISEINDLIINPANGCAAQSANGKTIKKPNNASQK
jgi:hypothetical protein